MRQFRATWKDGANLRDQEPRTAAGVLPVLRAGRLDREEPGASGEGAEGDGQADPAVLARRRWSASWTPVTAIRGDRTGSSVRPRDAALGAADWRHDRAERERLKGQQAAALHGQDRHTRVSEDSLEELKARRNEAQSAVVDVDESESAENFELPGADLSGEELSVRVIPKQADEFTCSSCFLVHHQPAGQREERRDDLLGLRGLKTPLTHPGGRSADNTRSG